MADFPSGAGYSKFLAPMEKINILSVGYNNLEYMKPQQNFWEQKHYTLHFVLRGKGTVKIGGKTHNVFTHNFFALPAHTSMIYYPDPSDKWAYVWFTLDGTGVKQLFTSLNVSIDMPIIATEYGSYISSLLADLFASEEECGNIYKVSSVFYEILHCITEPQGKTSQNIKPVIDRNYQEHNFTMAKLCADCGLSHAQMCRVFKRDYGISPKQYLTEKRIKYAKKLLLTTNLKIEAVAYSCGYTDAVNFMKEFKKKVGISAGEYRRENPDKSISENILKP